MLYVTAFALLGWLRTTESFHHQQKNIWTLLIGLIVGALTLVWAIWALRLRWRTWGWISLGIAGLAGLGMSLFHITGVTGDLVPILEWRWASRSATPPSPTSVPQADAHLPPASSLAYPQFLGPNRTAILPHGPVLETNWSASPPAVLWRHPVGTGWSGFAVDGRHAITQEQRGNHESVVCYDTLTGEERWHHEDPFHFQSSLGGEGPRATPTIDGNLVFTMGAEGMLNCLQLADGRRVWSRNVLTENESSVPEWGLACSPLVYRGMVIVAAGGKGSSLVAYDRESGVPVWGGGNAPAGYSSPFAARLAGRDQILIFHQQGVAGHDPQTGKVLWEFPWPADHPHVAMPLVVSENRVLISSGYGTGSALIELSPNEAGQQNPRLVWKSRRLKSKFNNMIQWKGFIYGLDDGILTCLDLQNGERRWKEGRYRHGQMILVNPKQLLVLSEGGEAILVEPNPSTHHEWCRTPVLEGKTWNPPALAGPLLVVRNHKEAAVYRLPTHAAP